MKKSLWKRAVILALLTGCTVSVSAQTESHIQLRSEFVPEKSLSEEDEADCFHTHQLRVSEILVPSLLVGTSALFLGNGVLGSAKKSVQDVLSARGRNSVKVDDYLQYAPMVATYGLHLSGVRGAHNFKEKTILLAMSYAVMGAAVNTMKFAINERRPDSSARNSFPSGHTATAFMAAEFLNKEYKGVSPWIGYAGYAVAAVTGYLRIYNDRHYVSDVVAGACIGVMSVKLSYWLYPKIFKRSSCNTNGLTASVLPYYTHHGGGLSLHIAL